MEDLLGGFVFDKGGSQVFVFKTLYPLLSHHVILSCQRALSVGVYRIVLCTTNDGCHGIDQQKRIL